MDSDYAHLPRAPKSGGRNCNYAFEYGLRSAKRRHGQRRWPYAGGCLQVVVEASDDRAHTRVRVPGLQEGDGVAARAKVLAR